MENNTKKNLKSTIKAATGKSEWVKKLNWIRFEVFKTLTDSLQEKKKTLRIFEFLVDLILNLKSLLAVDVTNISGGG